MVVNVSFLKGRAVERTVPSKYVPARLLEVVCHDALCLAKQAALVSLPRASPLSRHVHNWAFRRPWTMCDTCVLGSASRAGLSSAESLDGRSGPSGVHLLMRAS